MHNDNNKFSYTYSAPTEAERREVESIRRQYKTDTAVESKVDRLRKLHSRVMGVASSASLAVGIIGLLIFGLGMAMVLEFGMIIGGIIVSSVGICPILLAYPIYNIVVKRGKKKYGDEILSLSEEILGENK